MSLSVALLGFLLLFAAIAIPMGLLVAAAVTERAPAVMPTPRSERAGLALVVLCFAIPIIVAVLRSTH
jgi:hypothetical protein